MIIAWEATPRPPTPASSSHWVALGGVHQITAGTTVMASDTRQKYASMVTWLSPTGRRFTRQTARAMPATEASATRAAGSKVEAPGRTMTSTPRKPTAVATHRRQRSEEHKSEHQSLM